MRHVVEIDAKGCAGGVDVSTDFAVVVVAAAALVNMFVPDDDDPFVAVVVDNIVDDLHLHYY